jgi:hypothetical protein
MKLGLSDEEKMIGWGHLKARREERLEKTAQCEAS